MRLRHHPRRAASTGLGLMLVMAVTAAPAGAVSEGQLDTANAYPFVGRLEILVEGEWLPFCSGSLIEPDVVLTAAHCGFALAMGFVPPEDIRVNFNPLASGAAGPDALAYASVGAAVPADFGEPSPVTPGRNAMGEPWNDIALVWLAAPVVGIDPAPIAGPGYLDAPGIRDDTFTVVGYGLGGFLRGSALAPAQQPDFPAGRTFRSDVRLLGEGLYPDRYVQISESVCFDDSGGPLLHDGTVVGINVWTNSWRCAGAAMDFRVDSGIGQAFLDEHL